MNPRSHRLRHGRLVVAVLAVVAAAVSGCEAVLGMDGHGAHLLAADATAGDALGAEDAGDAGDSGPAVIPCVLPSAGASADATLRVGNLVPSTARVDVCLTRAGGASPLDGQPILASATGSCRPGLGYKDVTVPFELPSGSYSVAVVPAGAGCGATPVATATVTASPAAGAAVYLLGDGATPATTLVLQEESPAGLQSALRFVHAMADVGPLDFDLTVPGVEPPKLSSLVCPAVPFGAVGQSTNSQLPSDALGYEQFSLLGGTLPVGAGPAGTSTVTLTAVPVFAEGDSYSAFAIGKPADPRFPAELYVCDEKKADGVFTQCANGGATDVAVEVFDPYLWGPFAPLIALRQPAVVAAIAGLTSDVVCIPDAYPDALDQAIIGQAKARFPYAVHFVDTLSTPVDDPTLADGGLPPAPTMPPCAGSDAALEPFLSCVRQYCTAPLGSDDASVILEPSACITANCSAEAEALVLGTDLQTLQCWACAIFNLQGDETIAQARAACTTDVRAGYAFGGQSGSTLLSRYPIGNAEQWVLPATDWRSTILRAPLTLPGGKELDAYCLMFSDPVASLTVPYTGAYGGGMTGVAGWQAELALQAQKTVAYVQRKSPGTPAIVAGEFYAGPAAPDGTPPYNPAAYQILASAFALAAPPGGPPGCTFCAKNPIISPPGSTPATTKELTTYPLLWNVPVTDVLAVSVELDTPLLDAGTTEAGAYVVPLSTYYAYRATVRIRP